MNVTLTVESLIQNLVNWLRLAVESTGAITISIGSAISLYRFARALFSRQETDFNAIRLTLARYLALALEF